jgi:hypothetical protein
MGKKALKQLAPSQPKPLTGVAQRSKAKIRREAVDLNSDHNAQHEIKPL